MNRNDIDITVYALEALKEEQELRINAEAQLEAQKDKVFLADALTASDDSILIGELAILLQQNGVETGQNRLFEWMRCNGYLLRQGCGQNLPTQFSMEQGLMEVNREVLRTPQGRITIGKTTKITPKGQQYFLELFLTQKAV